MDVVKSKNKGYSLVETIIVIAIIGVVSVMAMASVSMIHSAKCKDAAVVFDSEVSELIAQAKSMNDSSKMYALRVWKDGANYYIQRGTIRDDAGTLKFKIDADNANDLRGKAVSKYVRISYTAESGSGLTYPEDWDATLDATWTAATSIVCDGAAGSIFNDGDALTGVFIQVTKSGDIISGNGAFCFFKKNGSQVARVYVRKNGSHEAR